jgi:hypothetical protein
MSHCMARRRRSGQPRRATLSLSAIAHVATTALSRAHARATHTRGRAGAAARCRWERPWPRTARSSPSAWHTTASTTRLRSRCVRAAVGPSMLPLARASSSCLAMRYEGTDALRQWQCQPSTQACTSAASSEQLACGHTHIHTSTTCAFLFLVAVGRLHPRHAVAAVAGPQLHGHPAARRHGHRRRLQGQ